jgi:hypothetical protein
MSEPSFRGAAPDLAVLLGRVESTLRAETLGLFKLREGASCKTPLRYTLVDETRPTSD